MDSERVEKLTALLELVRAATGPDRVIDFDIEALFTPREELRWPDRYTATAKHWDKKPVEQLTSSIDAAVGLVERMLPDWQGIYICSEWTGIRFPGNGVTYEVTLRHSLHSYRTAEGKGATRALAILDALLSALLAQHDAMPS